MNDTFVGLVCMGILAAIWLTFVVVALVSCRGRLTDPLREAEEQDKANLKALQEDLERIRMAIISGLRERLRNEGES